MGTMYKKQVKTAIVNPVSNSGITEAVSQNVAGISGFLESKADDIKQQRIKQAKLEYNSLLLDATSSLSNSMYNSYSNLSADPEKLAKDFTETKNKLSSGLPDEMKLDIEKQYLTLRNNYLIKADENRKTKLDSQNRDSILSFIDSKLGSAQVYYDNMFNGTLTPETTADYQINKQVIDKTLLQTGTKGQNLIKTSDVEKINKTFNQTKINSALNYFNGLFEKDKDEFLTDVNKWEQNPLTMQQQYDLKPEEYNSIISYAGKLKKADGDQDKTTQQKLIDVEVQTGLETTYNNIGFKTNKEDLKSIQKKYRNIETMIDFANAVDEAYSNGNIKNEEYQKYKSDVSLAVNKMIGDEDYLRSENKGFFKDTAYEYIDKNLNAIFTDVENDKFNKYDKFKIYQNIVNQAKSENINLKGVSSEKKDKVKKIINDSINQYLENKYLTLKETPVNAVVEGNNVIPYDKKAKTVGNKKLNSGRTRKNVNGEDFDVVLNSDGKIIQAFDMNGNEVKVK